MTPDAELEEITGPPPRDRPPAWLRLERFAYTTFGTFGRLFGPAGLTLFTLERDWLDNAVNVSCIPPGVYAMRRGTFRGQYPNAELLEVPGRVGIEIHRANTDLELRGCIAPGLELGVFRNRWAVMKSTPAVALIVKTLDRTEWEGAEIEILSRPHPV